MMKVIDPGEMEQKAFDDGYLQALRDVKKIISVLRLTRSSGNILNILEYEISTLKRNTYGHED